MARTRGSEPNASFNVETRGRIEGLEGSVDAGDDAGLMGVRPREGLEPMGGIEAGER